MDMLSESSINKMCSRLMCAKGGGLNAIFLVNKSASNCRSSWRKQFAAAGTHALGSGARTPGGVTGAGYAPPNVLCELR